MKLFGIVTDILYKALLAFCCAAIAIMVAVIAGQVFCRFVLNFTPYWTEELSLIIMIYTGFLGAAAAYKKRAHIRLEFFLRSAPPRVEEKIHLFIDSALLVFSAHSVYYGWLLTERTLRQINPALGWPVACSYAVIPVSGAIFFLFAVEKIMEDLSGSRRKPSEV